MTLSKLFAIGVALVGAVLGVLIAWEGREFASTFRLIGLVAVAVCVLSVGAMFRAAWARLPLAAAAALSALVAADALFGDRRDDDPMSSPLFGYALFSALAAVLLVVALLITGLEHRRSPEASTRHRVQRFSR